MGRHPETDPVKPRRSLLFVPADRPERVGKAATLPADAVILDLEDGVHPGRKDDARRHAAHALHTIDFGDREVIVRINGPGSGFIEADLQALPGFRKPPDTVMVPKLEQPSDLVSIARRLEEHDLACGLIPCIESARGVLAASEIACAVERNVALMFGGHDLAAELGITYAWEPLLFARSQLVLAAAAAGVDAVDAPWIDLDDQAGLAAESSRARQSGFVGKAVIHPQQLEAVNVAFSPTAAELVHAQQVIAAAGSHSGAFRLGSKMVDVPVVRAARRTLAVARRLGMVSR